MINKSDFHGIPYLNTKRVSPHGYLISKIYNMLKNYTVLPDDVISPMIKNGRNFLDIGCGDGFFCFKNKDKFNKIFGIDVSEFRIKNAKQNKLTKHNKKFIFRTGDMDSRLPFKSDYFDTVTLIAAFQYCYDPFFTLREMRRVLKKGGSLYIQVTNMAWFIYRIQLLLGKQLFTSMAHFQTWDGGILHYFTYSSLAKLINSSGFVVKKSTCSGLFRNLKLIYPSLLASDIIIKAIKK